MSTGSTDRFLRACRGLPTDRVPVWFMRQAGRSLPEYRELRRRHSILEMIDHAELAAEVTLQPLKRYDVDAAILFSDIVVVLRAMGVELEIVAGRGPVIATPVRSPADVERLAPFDADKVASVIEAARIVAAETTIPLIGFAGAPFTLASYLIEGGGSRHHERTRAFMHAEPEAWDLLLTKLAHAVAMHLRAQVDAGARAVQIFDSWVGSVGLDDYIARVRPATETVLREVHSEDVPRILFGVGTGELLSAMAASGADVVGVDWRVPLDVARSRTSDAVALQGNLDPAICLAPWRVVEEHAVDVLVRGAGRGHVFNLGHGVLPATDPSTLQRLADLVHEWEPVQHAA